MTTLTLKNRTIRRSGAGLAITGQNQHLARCTVTGVPQIYPATAAHALPHGAGRTKEHGPVTVELAL